MPSSNGVAERTFNVMNSVKTKLRNKMQTELLSSILRIKIQTFMEFAVIILNQPKLCTENLMVKFICRMIRELTTKKTMSMRGQ